MASLKDLITKSNAIACSADGWFLGTCKNSLLPNKNYLLLLAGALLFTYIVPCLLVIIIIPAIIGNVLAFDIIQFFTLFNPFFVLAYIPLFIADAIFVSILLIVSAAITIMYWVYYFREIGILSIIPMFAWVIAIVSWLIPVIGPIISATISAIPLMPIAVALHWYAYNDSKSIFS
jgi:hypothetical protein